MHRSSSSSASSVLSSPRKRRRIPPFIEDADYVNWLVQDTPSPELFRDYLSSSREIYLQLRKVDNVESLLQSLAETRTDIYLWPTSVPKPSLRGRIHRFFGPAEGQFVMLGRALVKTVVDELKGWYRVFLYGPPGVGKSHVLAAVALYLSVLHAKGEVGAKPVCYIPDMKIALENDKYVFQCFVQAFIDQPVVLREILTIGADTPALVNWVCGRSNVTVIAAQCNEIPTVKGNWGNSSPMERALDKLIGGGLGFDNKFLFAASSNQTKVNVFDMSTGADTAVNLLMEKFSYKEYCQFVTGSFKEESLHFVPKPANSRPATAPAGSEPNLIDVIEDVTGFVPLQVYELCLETKKRRSAKTGSRWTLEDVRGCIDDLSATWSQEIVAKVTRDFYKNGTVENLEAKVEMMSLSCGGVESFKDMRWSPTQLDWRYFYPEGPSMVAKVISKLALGAVIAATVSASLKLDAAKRKQSLASLSSAMSVNPSVRGFIIETIVNECLKVSDWRELVKLFKFPEQDKLKCPVNGHRSLTFGSQWNNQTEITLEPTLLIPSCWWRYPLVDSVIIYRHDALFYVIGIQITTQTPQEHRKSLEFVTVAKNHRQFIPEGYKISRKYRVGLLWIVHKKKMSPLPSVYGVLQTAYALENFDTVYGIPIPLE